MPVQDRLKSVAVASANDAAVALAEAVAGSEGAFVERMNERASQLGMADTHFSNCTGLPTEGEHLTSAWDIALMSRALLGHEGIRPYTAIWTDSVRDGAFGLSNTNKLVRYYPGCTGLKTGYTREAMFCLSASACRDGTEFMPPAAPSASTRPGCCWTTALPTGSWRTRCPRGPSPRCAWPWGRRNTSSRSWGASGSCC